LISLVACRYEAFCLVAGKITSHGRQWRGDGWWSADGPDLARGAGRLGSADAVDDAVAEAGRQARRRDGKLPPHVMVYFAMAMALFASVILSFRVSRGCDLRHRVADSVVDAMAAA
jgi:hypothetical protein